MQLRSARLCLDCEELHEEPQCPACASEAFAYLTRWIPVDERKKRKRAPRPPAKPRVSGFVTGGAVGFALLATARWLLREPAATADRRGSATTPPDREDGPTTAEPDDATSE